MFLSGPQVYRALGGSGGELNTALSYSNVVFAGNVLLWGMNALASVPRHRRHVRAGALVICAGVVFLVPLSPCLIFGVGPFMELGVAGAGLALVLFTPPKPRCCSCTFFRGATPRGCDRRA